MYQLVSVDKTLPVASLTVVVVVVAPLTSVVIAVVVVPPLGVGAVVVTVVETVVLFILLVVTAVDVETPLTGGWTDVVTVKPPGSCTGGSVVITGTTGTIGGATTGGVKLKFKTVKAFVAACAATTAPCEAVLSEKLLTAKIGEATQVAAIVPIDIIFFFIETFD